jgi:hypothetical protein
LLAGVRTALFVFDALAVFCAVLGFVFAGLLFTEGFCLAAVFFVLGFLLDALLLPEADLVLLGFPVDFAGGVDFCAMMIWRIIAQTGYQFGQPKSGRASCEKEPTHQDAVKYSETSLVYPGRNIFCSKLYF